MNLAKSVQSVVGRSYVLKWLDGNLCGREIRNFPPPIFLIGAPRVGSTLLYQAITGKYETAYLTNLHSLFYSEPCLADRLAGLLQLAGVRHKTSCISNYGFVRGILAPSEAGPTFRHWFGEADFDIGSHVTDCQRIRLALSCMCSSKGKPFVAKNLFNSMRLREIIKCFPDVFLVWVRREKTDVAQSMLKMRQKLCKDSSRWISVKVPHWQQWQELSPEEQVSKQIEAVEAYIHEIMSGRDAAFGVQVNYAELRKEPEHVVDFIMSRYSAATSITVLVRNTFSPEIFQQIRK